MKFFEKMVLLCVCAFSIATLHGQSSDRELTAVQVLSPQTFYLNGGTRATFGGKSRTWYSIQFPPNTVEWYYAFSTAPSEGSEVPIDLIGQLTRIVDPTGLTAVATSAILTPTGSNACDIYLMDRKNADAFKEKVDNWGGSYTYKISGSRENFRNGTVQVKDITSGTWCLGFKNPSASQGISITFEVVALVANKTEPKEGAKNLSDEQKMIEGLSNSLVDFAETIQESKAQKQAQLEQNEEWLNYWNAGWILFEAGDYAQATTYTEKALEMGEHPGLYFNLGLIQWVEGKQTPAMESYLKGLNLIYNLESKSDALNSLSAAKTDINNTSSRVTGFNHPDAIYRLIDMKQAEVDPITNWKKRN